MDKGEGEWGELGLFWEDKDGRRGSTGLKVTEEGSRRTGEREDVRCVKGHEREDTSTEEVMEFPRELDSTAHFVELSLRWQVGRANRWCCSHAVIRRGGEDEEEEV